MLRPMRIAFILFILAITISMSSCYKIWTCECELKNRNPQSTGGVGYADATNPGFKKKRKAECEEMQATFSANLAPGETMECTLK